MAILKIFKYPDPVLRDKAKPVERIDSSIRKLAEDMAETMYNAPGIGLAANQVGELKRIIVVDLQNREENHSSGLIVLINPEIIETSGLIKCEEGCLSVPGFYSKVKRHERIVVQGKNLDGKLVKIDAQGLLSVALQHEIDHLDGILFIDRLGPVGRELFKRKWKKAHESSSEK